MNPYGPFDDTRREYVIPRLGRPFPWIRSGQAITGKAEID
jgi:hypothetical protein